MAGHSKWANIRHRKGRQDAKRSKIWSKCSRAIIVAAKNGGGDPAMNLTLRYAIDEAKAANMPKDTIQKAIDKGSGDGEGASYEEIRYEGYGPAGVAVMLDLLTDNRNRTASEVRYLFEKYNGNLGATGCVSYMFEQKGEIFLEKSKIDEEALMDLALEAGAEDIADEGEAWHITTAPSDYTAVRDALEAADLEIDSATLAMVPDNHVAVEGNDVQKVLTFIEMIEDHDDVQKLHHNAEIDDEAMAALDG
ncbi:YebC/PmpR family DNA-binding transcriptional regulator [Algisphaera agarilytica]|uniref:Probable transcriptional regulatory protein HNQ40_001359 n=1 Tax=Algisphaera agarilytica TaxID=1385975 RepID=A0A7X0H5K4_9BACT|nr:YebC/PmpR family DNA-binding transcriptional regulator [Algisphaera agarilytica]MBB6429553.1 YebC/PmpR family DNA-binding regulatory protein [Algisphaera agarilytica]